MTLGGLQDKPWRTIVDRDKNIREVFKKPPLIAYKRQQNLKGMLIRAKKAAKGKKYTARLGMKECGNNCTQCPYICEGKSIKIYWVYWKINRKLSCKSFHVVYAIVCSKENCKLTYIGETKQTLMFRFNDHCGYVNNSINTATGSHFTQLGGQPDCSLQIKAIEQIKKIKDNE